MKKIWAILLLIPLMTGCYARHSGFPWFGSSSIPDKVEVQKGDTLYAISRKYDVSISELIDVNNLDEPYTLNVGQTLKLPHAASYTVAKGDTLYSIARKNDVDVHTLSKINNIKSPYTLYVGQTLNLSNTPVHKNSTKVYAQNNSAKTKSVQTVDTANKTASNKQIRASSRSKAISVSRKSKFMWPVNGAIVSNFGIVGKGRRNDGINIKAALGTNVKAADKGVVAYAGNELKGFGNLVLIKHADGYITAYAHNAKLFVKKGQTVLRGEKIATVGSTGSVNTPQLHFEVRAGKKAVNPRSYLP